MSGNEAHHRGRLAQCVQHLADAVFGAQRQRDPYLVRRTLAFEVRPDAVDAAQNRNAVDHALGARVVVEAAHVEAAPRRRPEPCGDLTAVRAGADDDDVAQVAAAPAQGPQHHANRGP